MAEPQGRPKTLVRRHVLEIKEDTREWLEEQMELFLTKKATADIAKSFLSTNAGAIIASLGVMTTLMAIPQTRELIVNFISFWRSQITNTLAQAIDSTLNIPSIEDIQKQLRDALDKLFPPPEEVPPEIIFGAAGPSGIPLDPALAERLRKEGVQPPQ